MPSLTLGDLGSFLSNPNSYNNSTPYLLNASHINFINSTINCSNTLSVQGETKLGN